jgi:hypothetical protein
LSEFFVCLFLPPIVYLSHSVSLQFGAVKMAEPIKQAMRQLEEEEKRREENTEPEDAMAKLEERTAASKQEMDTLDLLEELKERNLAASGGLDPELIVQQQKEAAAEAAAHLRAEVCRTLFSFAFATLFILFSFLLHDRRRKKMRLQFVPLSDWGTQKSGRMR